MANVLTDRAAHRIRQAVQWVEGNRGVLPGAGIGHAACGESVTVRVTSGTADGNGNYPGVITAFDGDTWTDYAEIVIRPNNSETLTNGRRYPARRSGLKDDDPVYIAEGYVGGAGTNPCLAFWSGSNTVDDSVCKDGGHLLYNSTISSGTDAGYYDLADVITGGSVEFPGDSALPSYYLYTDADTDVFGFQFEAGAQVYGQLLMVANSKTSTHSMTLKHGSGFSPAATDLHNGAPGSLDSAYDVILGPAQAVLYVWWGSWILVGCSAPVPSAAPSEIDGGTW